MRYELDRKAVIIIAILVNLGLFQIAEWQVCANAGAQVWARIGFIATAILIPLGVDFIHHLAPSQLSKTARSLAWITAGAFIAWFVLVPNSVNFVFCGGNYSIYRLSIVLGYSYAAFYWGWLFFTVWMANRSLRFMKMPRDNRAMQAFMIGYGSFIIPTLISNAAAPETLKAIPSILCGFAIFFAIILVGFVAPNSLVRKKS